MVINQKSEMKLMNKIILKKIEMMKYHEEIVIRKRMVMLIENKSIVQCNRVILFI